MINVIVNGKKTTVDEGTRVIELLPKERRCDYIVCKIGSQTKELNRKLFARDDGKTIEFLGLDNSEAGKAYEASLRYIVAMAFHNLYPDVRIRFGYNASRSVFCEVLTKGFNVSRATELIKNEVDAIVEANLPIERISVSTEEAKAIYQRMNRPDKADILKYRPESNVNIYKCGDYYDYLHTYMVPSTGCVKGYLLHPYSPGIILQYPRHELDGEIPEFQEESTYGKTLSKARNWQMKTGNQTIFDINQRVESGNVLDFVQMCEARHNSMLGELGSMIEQNKDDIRLICIAGPSSSGKTTFCNRVRIELMSRGINPVMISMDDYYLPREVICELQNATRETVDLEHVNCLDIERFNKDLFDLINGEEVTLPRFDFQIGKRVVGRTIKVDEHSPIMIEGIHALNEKLTASIPKHQKFKIYIAPQLPINIDDHSPLSITDLRLIRRIVRDMQFRNYPAANTIDMWQSVRNGEFRWIYPHQEGVDFVFNSALPYELCVLKKLALPTLKQIKDTDPQYLVANRLIKYLKYFKTIDDESLIPCNSLIREFIGGSCFKV